MRRHLPVVFECKYAYVRSILETVRTAAAARFRPSVVSEWVGTAYTRRPGPRSTHAIHSLASQVPQMEPVLQSRSASIDVPDWIGLRV